MSVRQHSLKLEAKCSGITGNDSGSKLANICCTASSFEPCDSTRLSLGCVRLGGVIRGRSTGKHILKAGICNYFKLFAKLEFKSSECCYRGRCFEGCDSTRLEPR